MINRLEDEDLIIIDKKFDNEYFKYLSEKISYKDLKENLYKDFKEKLQEELRSQNIREVKI